MSWTMFDSIRTRLTLWYTGMVAVFIIAFFSIVYVLILNNQDRSINSRLEEMARSFASASEAEEEDQNRESNDDLTGAGAIVEAAGEMRFRDYHFIIYHSNGQVASSTADFEQALGPNSAAGFEDVDIKGSAMRSFTTTLTIGNESYYLRVFHSLEEKEAAARLMQQIFLLSLPVTLLFAALGGYMLARKSLSPVAEMSRQARDISAQNLNQRLPIKNERDELGELASVMNDLLARLDLSFEQQRRFMADASHELRTPIAIIRGESEIALSKPDRPNAAYRESLAIVEDESKRLSRIVEDLLTMARADSGQFKISLKPVYLEEIVEDAVRSIGVLARTKNIDIQFISNGEMPMKGDELLLGRLFRNLCENAVKYGRRDGNVVVKCEESDNGYRIEIADDGCGIAPDEKELIFDRFYRSDRSRDGENGFQANGAGLGLAIAKWIADVHGSDLTLVGTSKNGSVFSVEFSR